MKTNVNSIRRAAAIIGLAAPAFLSGCVVGPYGGNPVVEGPPPGVFVDVGVYPDDYWWDGYEYVGIVGGQYYYLGPRNVWIVCEPFRVARFETWQRGHADWRSHPTHNERYRPADRGRGRGGERGHDRGFDGP